MLTDNFQIMINPATDVLHAVRQNADLTIADLGPINTSLSAMVDAANTLVPFVFTYNTETNVLHAVSQDGTDMGAIAEQGGSIDPSITLTPTGNYVAPTNSQLVHGQSCGVSGSVSGTQYVPVNWQVLYGVSVGTGTGLNVSPAIDDVIYGVRYGWQENVGQLMGNYYPIDPSHVESGCAYGPGDAQLHGTYLPLAVVKIQPVGSGSLCLVGEPWDSVAHIGTIRWYADGGGAGFYYDTMPYVNTIDLTGYGVCITIGNFGGYLSNLTTIMNIGGPYPAPGTNWALAGAALSLTTIDAILAWVANGSNAVTMDLSGGTSSAPDDTGWANWDIATGYGSSIIVNGSHP